MSRTQENEYVFADFDFHNAGYNQSNVTYRAPVTLPNNRMVVYELNRTTPVLEYIRQ